MDRKAGGRIKLYSRPGNGLTRRFALIVQAVAKLRAAPAAMVKAWRVRKKVLLASNYFLVRWDGDGGVR